MSKTASTLTQSQLAQLRSALEAKREELRRKIDESLGVTRTGGSDLIEKEDVATQEIGVADAENRLAQAQGLLEEVEQALAKFDDGTYGASERSGRPIPYARLEILPWARVDAEEATEDELRERQMRGRR